jgi:hypothetical protein
LGSGKALLNILLKTFIKKYLIFTISIKTKSEFLIKSKLPFKESIKELF